MPIERGFFYNPEDIFRDVQNRLAEANRANEQADYLTFVPDGEPTLDKNLGKEISLLKELGVPVGVITNGSLLWRNDVRRELNGADWVSLKIDSVQETTWRNINRPHKKLSLIHILDGLNEFAESFKGILVTETMLVEGLNDNDDCMKQTAAFLERLRPYRAYLSIPTRPPAESWVNAPDEKSLNRMYHILAEKIERVEYLIDYEGDSFASTGDVEKDILNITAVHPMREEAVGLLLSRAGYSGDLIGRLLASGDLVKTNYKENTYYMRRFKKIKKAAT